MYSPDEQSIDPRNPANWAEGRYSVCEYKCRNSRVTINHVSDERHNNEVDAKAELLALKNFHGEELSVLSFDDEGDETCHFCAEWSDEQRCYVAA